MRNTIEILVWLRRQGIKQTQIARECGKYKANVWDTVHGRRSDRKILAWLKDKGCPVEYLNLPAKMREAA